LIGNYSHEPFIDFVVDVSCVNVVAILSSSDICLHWQVYFS